MGRVGGGVGSLPAPRMFNDDFGGNLELIRGPIVIYSGK